MPMVETESPLRTDSFPLGLLTDHDSDVPGLQVIAALLLMTHATKYGPLSSQVSYSFVLIRPVAWRIYTGLDLMQNAIMTCCCSYSKRETQDF